MKRSRAGTENDKLAVALRERDGKTLGAIGTVRPEAKRFTDKELRLLATIADQAVIAIENVRLFNEIQEKSAQLEVANQHKSEFLANMSCARRSTPSSVSRKCCPKGCSAS